MLPPVPEMTLPFSSSNVSSVPVANPATIDQRLEVSVTPGNNPARAATVEALLPKILLEADCKAEA